MRPLSCETSASERFRVLSATKDFQASGLGPLCFPRQDHLKITLKMVSFRSFERLHPPKVVDRSGTPQGRQRDLPECTSKKERGKRAKWSEKGVTGGSTHSLTESASGCPITAHAPTIIIVLFLEDKPLSSGSISS